MNNFVYKIADKTDLKTMLDIRFEMLKNVNNLQKDYKFPDEFIDSTRRYFEQGDQTTVLAFDNDKAIGCATMSYIEMMPTFSHPTGRRGHLMNVYTNATYRKHGIGKAMVLMLIEDAKKNGATEISLDATDMGRYLYKSLGFVTNEEGMLMTL